MARCQSNLSNYFFNYRAIDHHTILLTYCKISIMYQIYFLFSNVQFFVWTCLRPALNISKDIWKDVSTFFITLDFGCVNDLDHPFTFWSEWPKITHLSGFPEETWLERLFLFQEAIVGRFGFIKCTAESTSHESGVGDHLYVHVTGNMFILIPTTVKSQQKAMRTKPAAKPVNSGR